MKQSVNLLNLYSQVQTLNFALIKSKVKSLLFPRYKKIAEGIVLDRQTKTFIIADGYSIRSIGDMLVGSDKNIVIQSNSTEIDPTSNRPYSIYLNSDSNREEQIIDVEEVKECKHLQQTK